MFQKNGSAGTVWITVQSYKSLNKRFILVRPWLTHTQTVFDQLYANWNIICSSSPTQML